MSSVRLDSFVYTVESFREARALLKDHGLVCVQHSLGSMFILNRVYRMLADAFGASPGLLGSDNPTFIVGQALPISNPPPPTMKVPEVVAATDDWPFFYMAGRYMPPEYRTALEMMALIAVVLVLLFTKGRPCRLQANSGTSSFSEPRSY